MSNICTVCDGRLDGLDVLDDRLTENGSDDYDDDAPDDDAPDRHPV